MLRLASKREQNKLRNFYSASAAGVRPINLFSKKSIRYDGVDEWVSVADSTRFDNVSGDFTASIWFKLTNTFDNTSATSMGLFGKYLDTSNHVSLSLAGSDNSRTTGSLYFKLENTSAQYLQTTQLTWTADVWYFALANYNITSGLGQLYINNVLDGSASSSGQSTWALATPFNMGRIILEQAGAVNKYFEGELNNFSLFKTEFDSTERTEIWNDPGAGGRPMDLNDHSQIANLEFWYPSGAEPDDLEIADGVIENIAGTDDGTATNMLNATGIVNEAPGL